MGKRKINKKNYVDQIFTCIKLQTNVESDPADGENRVHRDNFIEAQGSCSPFLQVIVSHLIFICVLSKQLVFLHDQKVKTKVYLS